MSPPSAGLKGKRVFRAFFVLLSVFLLAAVCVGVATADDTIPMSGFCGGDTSKESYSYSYLDKDSNQQQKTVYKNVEWTLTQNNNGAQNPTYTLTISGTGAMADFEESTGGNVNAGWGSLRKQITEVVVDGEITYVGAYSFKSFSNLAKVTLSDSITEIGDNAFYYAASNGMFSVEKIPPKLEKIGRSGFGTSGLIGNIVLPATTTEVGDAGFQSKITSFKTRSNTFSIGNYGLKSNNLETIDLSSVTDLTVGKIVTQGAGNVVIYVQTKDIRDSIFTSNGGMVNSFPGTHVKAFVVTNGGVYDDLPNELTTIPTRDGYVFAGWYMDSEFKEEAGHTGEGENKVYNAVEAKKTYYAKWILPSPTDVTVTADKTSIIADTTVTLKATASPDPTQSGVTYTYQWYKDGKEDAHKLSGQTSETCKVAYADLTDGSGNYYYCAVIATKEGSNPSNPKFSDAISITQAAEEGSVVISESVQTNVIYGDVPFTVTYTVNSDSTLITVTSSDEMVAKATIDTDKKEVTVTIIGTGTATISVNFIGDATYSSASDSFDLTVTQADQTLSFANDKISKSEIDTPFTIIPEHIGDGVISYTSSNVGVATVDTTTGMVTIVGTGTTKISATSAATNNYKASETVSYDLTVYASQYSMESEGVPEGSALVANDVSDSDQLNTLNTAITGQYSSQFSGGAPILINITLYNKNGDENHNQDITFTVPYPATIAGNYQDYNFIVLHLSTAGIEPVTNFEKTGSGLKITSKVSPFAIGYSLIPDDKPSSSSGSQGSSVWLMEVQQSTPTPTPTATPTQPEGAPTDIPDVKPTETPKSPAPILGIIAGLGCVVAVLRRR